MTEISFSLRIYPHLQDTGGFFVAVFDKVKPMSTAEERMHSMSTPAHHVEENEEQQKDTNDLDDTSTTVVPSKRSASDSDDPVTKSTSTKSSDTLFDLMQPDNAEIVDIR